jgi:hypothetical protein
MSFQQKNVIVSLVNFSLILGIFLIGVYQMIQNGSFTSTNVFRLFGIIIFLAVIVTVFATILTQVLSAVIQAIKTGDDDPKLEDFEDERDRIIDLRGTSVTYNLSSMGAFLAMLTFVFGLQPLVMFTLLIFFGVVAQIVGDIFRLYLYRRGFLYG